MATAQDQIRELKNEVRELANLIEKQAKQISHSAGGGLHVTRAELRDLAEHAGASTRRFIREKREQAGEAAHRYEDTVSAHPWKSTGIALLGGLLIGALMRR